MTSAPLKPPREKGRRCRAMLWGWNSGAAPQKVAVPCGRVSGHCHQARQAAECPPASPAELSSETELSSQMHFRSLPWRRKSANMTKNMHKINSLVRSGLATSFSLRGSALLWEALIIFYCFTHSQKYDETRTEWFFYVSLQ